MEVMSNLMDGFVLALSFNNLLACFIGVLIGTIVGVLPGIGPVGIENSWVVTAEGLEKLTTAPEEIIEL